MAHAAVSCRSVLREEYTVDNCGAVKKSLKKKAREMENKGMPERERAQSEKKRSGCFRRKGRETW